MRVTPRASLIATPSANQSFKYLFGSAFRAPTFYELKYSKAANVRRAYRSNSTSTSMKPEIRIKAVIA